MRLIKIGQTVVMANFIAISALVETICSEKKQMFRNVCLSSTTVTRRIEELSKDVKLSTNKPIQQFRLFISMLKREH